MSRAVRKQLFTTLNSLEKATKALDTILQDPNEQNAVDLLTSLQKCAIAIGNQIEAVYGNETQSVTALETYCEIIYQISTQLGQTDQEHHNYEKLCLQLQVIRQKMEQEIPDRYEIVFLPYKASMWDSLESVWLASREDDNCDSYVIPIPYYDKNLDGSFREMHWEGEEYPAYVPITKYDEYNFELRRPDAIVIHNPYDDGNYVTSVHPFFYAHNLKKFTDKLFYIPYFILREPNPDNKDDVDEISNFCLTEGVLNSERVFVQSENMRQMYVDILTKVMGNHPEYHDYWEKKICASGSPKVDKVLEDRNENITIPDEWSKLIKKADGTNKKIIFYNTSVSALLDHSDVMLEMIRDIFTVMREKQDEVVLLWRPHPLIQATIESLRPELWKAYHQLVEQYKSEGWGIYDDTAELDRAIKISDGYYGDRSSVVQLYQQTGKYANTQNFYRDVDHDTLICAQPLVSDQSLWISAINKNGLYRMNLEDHKLSFESFFTDLSVVQIWAHSRLFQYEDKIVAIPFQGNLIHIYDVTSHVMQSMTLPKNEFGRNYSYFNTAIQDAERIYMIPCRYGFMLEYNIKTNELIKHKVFDFNKNELWDINDPYILKGACKVGDYIYLGCYRNNCIEEYSLQTGQIHYIWIDEKLDGISHLLSDGQNIWVIGINGSIVQWDRSNGKFKCVYACKSQRKGQSYFFDVAFVDDKIIMTGALDHTIYSYNTKKNQMEVLYKESEQDHKLCTLCWADYNMLSVISQTKVLIQSAWTGSLIMIDVSNSKVEHWGSGALDMNAVCMNGYDHNLYRYFYDRTGNIDLKLSLRDLIKVICNAKETARISESGTKNGAGIYKTIKDVIHES